jgi:hypothetical protein
LVVPEHQAGEPVVGKKLVGPELVILVHGLKYRYAGDVGKRHDRSVVANTDVRAYRSDYAHVQEASSRALRTPCVPN